MARPPTWQKVHERLEDIIERLGEVRLTGDVLMEVAKIRLQLFDLQIQLEDLDVNFRPSREAQRVAASLGR